MVANSRTTTRTDAGHDPQYSALRLVAWDEDAADYHEPTVGALSPGDTVERYDYSPYGRRRVFGLTDALDVHGFHPLAQSQPIADPYGGKNGVWTVFEDDDGNGSESSGADGR